MHTFMAQSSTQQSESIQRLVSAKATFFAQSVVFLFTAVNLCHGRDRNSDFLTALKLSATLSLERTPIYQSIMMENNNGHDTRADGRVPTC